jgi:hypothetical protein
VSHLQGTGNMWLSVKFCSIIPIFCSCKYVFVHLPDSHVQEVQVASHASLNHLDFIDSSLAQRGYHGICLSSFAFLTPLPKPGLTLYSFYLLLFSHYFLLSRSLFFFSFCPILYSLSNA